MGLIHEFTGGIARKINNVCTGLPAQRLLAAQEPGGTTTWSSW
jgi:hypothetical protein